MKKLMFAVVLAAFVAAPALGYELTNIYEIQSGMWLPGTAVQVHDVIVTSGPYEFTSSGAYCFVEEAGGGAYSGIEVYWGSGKAAIYGGLQRGDVVSIYGVYDEYYDMSEIDMSGAGDTLIVTGTAPVPGPDLVDLSLMMDEPWEGVLVLTNCSVVTDPDLGYGEWEIDDGTGLGRCDDKGQITYVPALGDWRIYTGILAYSYGAYKLWPRDDNDIFDPGGPTATEPTNWGGIKALFR